MSDQVKPEEFLPYLISEDLYSIPEEKNSIESDKVESGKVAIVEEEAIPYSKEGVLVVTDHESLPEDQKTYLGKILGAVGLELSQANFSTSTSVIHKYEQVICFRKDQAREQKLYSIENEEGSQVIYSDPLDEVALSVDLRKQLWAGLQMLFEI